MFGPTAFLLPSPKIFVNADFELFNAKYNSSKSLVY